jgi:Armadillo/beta-catenin-like repeat
MEGLGLSAGEVNKKNLASRRFKKGECPTCGNKTHKVGFFGKRIALTIEGQSRSGQCLLCNPVSEKFARRPEEGGGSVQDSYNFFPRTLELEDRRYHANDDFDDDGTMVSGITMDHRLIAGEKYWKANDGNHFDEDYDSASELFDPNISGLGSIRRRPEASVGGDEGPPRRPPGRIGSIYTSAIPPPQPKRFVSSHEKRMHAIGSDITLGLESDSFSRSSQKRSRAGRKSSLPRSIVESMLENSLSEPSAPRDRSPSSARAASLNAFNTRSIDEENSASTKHSSDFNRQRDIRVPPFQSTSASLYSNDSRDHRVSTPKNISARVSNPRSEDRINNASWNGSAEFIIGGSKEFAVGIPHFAINDEFTMSGKPKANDFEPRDGGFRGAPLPLMGSASKKKMSLIELGDGDDDYNENTDIDHNGFRTTRASSKAIQPAINSTIPPKFQKSKSGFQPNHPGLQTAPSFTRSRSGVQETLGAQQASLDPKFLPMIRVGVGVIKDLNTDDHGDQFNSKHPTVSFSSTPQGRYNNRQEKPSVGIGEDDTGESEFIVLEVVPKERFSEGNRRQDPYADETDLAPQEPESYATTALLGTSDLEPDLGRSDNRYRKGTHDVDLWQERNRRGMPDGDAYSISSHSGLSPTHQGGQRPTLTVGNVPDTNKQGASRKEPHSPTLPQISQDYQSKSTLAEQYEVTAEDKYMRMALTATNLTVQNIPVILSSLNQANEKQRGNAFRNLAQIVFLNGQKAKVHSKQSYAIDVLIDAMWADMGNVDVIEGCCEYLFALVASTDGEASNDVLSETYAEKAIDALLISMQTHSSVEYVQRSGIGTLFCLAQASSNNPKIDDGTLSGAVLCVTNAMNTHRSSCGVQEWGIRAIYSQCIQSVNAESNKSSLAKAKNDDGAGLEVIAGAMETLKHDLMSLEWACRLYWCLSTNDDIMGSASSTPTHVLAIMNTVRAYSKRSSTSSLIAASYGALANFSRIDTISRTVVDAGFVPILIDSLRHYTEDEGVNMEACALLSNLAQLSENRMEIINCDGIGILSYIVHSFSKNSELQQEAIGALLCLAIGSDDAKMAIATTDTYSLIVQVLCDRNASANLHEMACSLLGSLCTLEGPAQLASSSGVIDSIFLAMQFRPRERIFLEAAMMALRNLICHGAGLEKLVGIDSTNAICRAMDSNPDSESVQGNGCYILWSICSKAHQEASNVIDAGGIEQIVKSMQSHMESAPVLEMACGALWSLVDKSDDRKRAVVGSGGIDAVTCALIMHPTETKILETACGVLSNISVKGPLALAVAESQGISIIVEAMGSSASSMCLLEFGALVLRNIVLTNPHSASEASNGISTIINGMKKNPNAVSFNVEACNALWAMAAQSEDCAAKILKLDGVTILMGALDPNNGVSDLVDAARGAINQLAMV